LQRKGEIRLNWRVHVQLPRGWPNYVVRNEVATFFVELNHSACDSLFRSSGRTNRCSPAMTPVDPRASYDWTAPGWV